MSENGNWIKVNGPEVPQPGARARHVFGATERAYQYRPEHYSPYEELLRILRLIFPNEASLVSQFALGDIYLHDIRFSVIRTVYNATRTLLGFRPWIPGTRVHRAHNNNFVGICMSGIVLGDRDQTRGRTRHRYVSGFSNRGCRKTYRVNVKRYGDGIFIDGAKVIEKYSQLITDFQVYQAEEGRVRDMQNANIAKVGVLRKELEWVYESSAHLTLSTCNDHGARYLGNGVYEQPKYNLNISRLQEREVLEINKFLKLLIPRAMEITGATTVEYPRWIPTEGLIPTEVFTGGTDA